MKQLSPMDIHNEGVSAAQKAEKEFRDKYGEPMYCGFAWSSLPDGRSAFTKALKAAGVASPGYPRGYRVWNPGGSFTQSMDIKEAGARAYSEVLRSYGISSWMSSRAD